MGWKLKTLTVVIVVGVFGAAVDDEEDADSDAAETPVATSEQAATPPEQQQPGSPGPTRDVTSGPEPTSEPTRTPRPEPKPEPGPVREPRTYLVTRVIDGDTIELASGAGVRVVGIDTPEEGDCGYDQATASMERLVLMSHVTLVRSHENADRYGRLLRYVDLGAVDAGLRQIKSGWAIARYDSRDGYGVHARESRYIAADRAAPDKSNGPTCSSTTPTQEPQPSPAPAGDGVCAPGYRPCIPPFPPDVDCGDVNGPINVSGSDPHGLDADGDEVACE